MNDCEGKIIRATTKDGADIPYSILIHAHLAYCPTEGGGAWLIKYRHGKANRFVDAYELENCRRRVMGQPLLEPRWPSFGKRWVRNMDRVKWGLYGIIGAFAGSTAGQLAGENPPHLATLIIFGTMIGVFALVSTICLVITYFDTPPKGD